MKQRVLSHVFRLVAVLALLTGGLAAQPALHVAQAAGLADSLAPQTSDAVTRNPADGPVIHSVTAYLIYWKQEDSSFLGQTFYFEAPRCYGPGCLGDYGTDKNYEDRTGNFLRDVGGSSWYATLSQYWDTDQNGNQVPIFNETKLGGTWLDTSDYPNEGRGVPAARLQPTDISAEINKAVQQNGWCVDANSMFFLYLPEEVQGCNNSGDCTDTTINGDACGFHDMIGVGGANVPYAVIPSPGDTIGCNVTVTSPSGDLMVDNAIDNEAHELVEAATNPFNFTGWSDPEADHSSDGGEIGDKCHSNFPGRGSVLADGGNVTINGQDYILQALWSDLDGGCVLGRVPVPYLDPGPALSLPVDADNPTLTINGHNFVPTSTVNWNGTPIQTTVVSSQQLTAVVPASDLTSPSVATITVSQQNTTGGTSNAQFVDIVPSGSVSITAANAGADSNAPISVGPSNAQLTVTPGQGSGAVGVAQLSGNPEPGDATGNTNAFFNLYVGPNAYNQVALRDCALNGGGQVDWYDPGSGWKAVSKQAYDPASGCATVTLDSTTSPNLSQLQGATFGGWTTVRGWVVLDRESSLVPTAQYGDSQPTIVQLGTHPHSLALSPDASTAYVANEGDNTIDAVALGSGAITHTFQVGSDPVALALTPDGKTLYSANQNDNTLSVINLSQGSTTSIAVGTKPAALAISRDGSVLYVANQGDNTLDVIATATNQVQSTIPAGAAPSAVGLSPDGKTAYVADSGANQVTPIALASGTPGTPIPVGKTPSAIAITPDGSKAYVANFDDNSVTPIDLSGSAPAPGSPIAVGIDPDAIAITPDGRTAEVANDLSGTISPIDVASNVAGPAFGVGLGNRSRPAAIALVSLQPPSQGTTSAPAAAPRPVATPAPTSTSAYAQAVLNDAPAGYWRLDETSPGTVADSSGHGLNGQTNGSIILGRPGPTQDNTTSMQFDGKTGYVSLGDPTALQPNAVSVEAWINANAGPGMIVRKRFDGYALSLNPSGQPVFEMNDANAIDYRVTGPTSIANGAWHHVVGTYDGQKVCLYVDGQPAGSCQPAGAIHYAADLVAIGRDGGASDDYFGGRIKDVAIYAKALSPQQVAAHLAAAAAAVNP